MPSNAERKQIEKFGGIDIAVNNAGIEGDRSPTAEYPIESFDKVMTVNARGIRLRDIICVCLCYFLPFASAIVLRGRDWFSVSSSQLKHPLRALARLSTFDVVRTSPLVLILFSPAAFYLS